MRLEAFEANDAAGCQRLSSWFIPPTGNVFEAIDSLLEAKPEFLASGCSSVDGRDQLVTGEVADGFPTGSIHNL